MVGGSCKTERRGRRASRRLTLAAIAALVVMSAGFMTGCDPGPGTANVALSGAVDGTAAGPTATCYPLDLYVEWRWDGSVAGRQVEVSVRLNAYLDEFPFVLLKVDGVDYRPQADQSGYSFKHFDDGMIRIVQDVAPSENSSGEPIHVAMRLRCPGEDPYPF